MRRPDATLHTLASTAFLQLAVPYAPISPKLTVHQAPQSPHSIGPMQQSLMTRRVGGSNLPEYVDPSGKAGTRPPLRREGGQSCGPGSGRIGKRGYRHQRGGTGTSSGSGGSGAGLGQSAASMVAPYQVQAEVDGAALLAVEVLKFP
jgi:hypothetical protein